jgi:N-acetylglucosaminyl-diphospho-decaprenol L-rhamnosyltransferase
MNSRGEGIILPEKCDISIIIVSYRCLESLRECLKSCWGQQDVSFEIIVLDNGLDRSTRDFLKGENLKAIFPERNVGFGRGVNIAFKQAIGDYIFSLNPDAVLFPNSLSDLKKFSESASKAGLISALLANNDGTTQISARKFPRRRDFFVGRGSPFFKLGVTNEKKAGYILISGDEPVRVEAVSATALFLKSDLFRMLGGFDERFFMYLEDIDLCKRAAQLGFETYILPGIKVIHGWRKSSGRSPYKAAFYHHLSVYKYFAKHYPREIIKNAILALALLAGFVVTLIMISLKGRHQE